jgi:hypothetical protein
MTWDITGLNSTARHTCSLKNAYHSWVKRRHTLIYSVSFTGKYKK